LFSHIPSNPRIIFLYLQLENAAAAGEGTGTGNKTKQGAYTCNQEGALVTHDHHISMISHLYVNLTIRQIKLEVEVTAKMTLTKAAPRWAFIHMSK